MHEKKYEKLDDQTLVVSQNISDLSNDSTYRHLRQIFNFRARSVVTIYETRYQGGTGSSMSPALSEKSFSEVEGKGVLADAHEKLLELGGNPDPLEDAEESKRKHGKTPLKLG